jgi:hypothetical protein
MVKLKVGKYTYDYPNEVMDTVKINKQIKEEFSKFCRERKINKCKLIEEFYKTILIRFKEGSLNSSMGYITLNIFLDKFKKHN